MIENRKEIDSIKNEKKEIGSRASIEAQIEKLTSQKDILSTDPNLSKEELNSYDETITNIDIVNEQILSLQKDLTNIQNIEAVVEKITFSFSLSDHIQELLNRATDDAIIAANTIWIQSKQAIIGNISKGLDKKKRRKDELLEIQDSLKSKVQKIRLSQNCQITSKKRIKTKIVNGNREKEVALIEKENAYISEICQSIEKFKHFHNQYAQTVNGKPEFKSNDLEFSVEVPFKKKHM